jgi:hypothetical protein
MHIHTLRTVAGWILGLGAVLTSIALAAPIGASTPRAGLVPVTGQVTLNGQPAGDVMMCFDAADRHSAYACSRADGSFELFSPGWGMGAVPNRYRVHLFSLPSGPALPARYQDVRTSGLVVEVGPDWDELSFDLR